MHDSSSDESSIFIVDDDEGMRNALLRLFRLEGIRAEAFASAEAFLDACRPDISGCLLVDVMMPGMDGLELQAELAARRIVLPVIIMTGAAEVEMAVQAMKAGAMDFIQKPLETAPLLVLVQEALNRHAHQRQTTDEHRAAVQKLALLTGREREIFDLVVRGKSCKVIAIELGISFRTVEKHRARIFSKLNAESLIELVQISSARLKRE